MTDEWWDVLDGHGGSTGEQVLRDGPDWPEGRYHLVVGVVPVRADGRVLLARRAATKDHPLTWEFPAGSALAGETGPEAAVRELGEESGLHVTPADLTFVRRITEARALFDVFVARVAQPEPVTPDPVEVDQAHWGTWEEFERRRDAGEFAGPWYFRFAVLGEDLRRAVDGAAARLRAEGAAAGGSGG